MLTIGPHVFDDVVDFRVVSPTANDRCKRILRLLTRFEFDDSGTLSNHCLVLTNDSLAQSLEWITCLEGTRLPNFLSYYLCSENQVMRFTRITISPDQMGGVPCLRGMRIPVATVVGMVADGMTMPEILQAYPDLETGDIQEALSFAAEAVRERELPLLVPA